MPESVKDRCTKAHEYIFLLTKKQKYFYDAEAVKEPKAESSIKRYNYPRFGSNNKAKNRKNSPYAVAGGDYSENEKRGTGRNKRSVWTISTQPYPEAHFATFPPKLIEPCILAGCPEGGVVLDPFMGSGTTAMVAMQNNRNFIGFELNPEYIKLAKKRISNVQLKIV
jgi:DNA modification methylase